MFDLFNFNIGGGGFGQRASGSGSISSEGARAYTRKRPALSEYAKKAKTLIRFFDVASLDPYELAAEVWEWSDDAQKKHIYGFIDGLIERALIAKDDGTAYSIVENEIADRADMIRETVYRNG